MTHKTSYFLLFISTTRLEATADADGDIGWSSQLDHSKELDLYFSELYWSSFLGSVQKKRYRNRMAYRGKMCLYVFARKSNQRTQIGFHHKVSTNDRYSFFMEKKTSLLWWGIIRVRSHNFEIVTKSHIFVTISKF